MIVITVKAVGKVAKVEISAVVKVALILTTTTIAITTITNNSKVEAVALTCLGSAIMALV